MNDTREDEEFWKRPPALFVLIAIRGKAGEELHEIQQRFDPRLARVAAPHVTLVGSSGLGPISARTTVGELREALEPIARSIPPFEMTFGRPVRFMQTDIVVLPLDPHGPLRQLHDRIGKSGLSFERARHMFTPHATLSLYKTLRPHEERALLALRVETPVLIDHLKLSLTDEPNPPRDVLELPLTG